MSPPASKEDLLAAIRKAVQEANGRRVSRLEFFKHSGMTQGDINRHFASWTDALDASGLELEPYRFAKLGVDTLLAEWGQVVRKHGQVPTRVQFRLRGGRHSRATFQAKFGSWSAIPSKFREYAQDKPEWADVLGLLPPVLLSVPRSTASPVEERTESPGAPVSRRARLTDRPTYGDPIDFRGLRHAPVNEDGVVFLFGMIARELGYLVEAVQAGFPDCEAKRQIAPGKWQRVRIEFEFESVNFREHGHPSGGCDVIVCWRHNWPDVPEHLEIVELREVIETLARTAE